MQAVLTTSRKVGDSIEVFDTLSGHESPPVKYTGTITKITKKIIELKLPLGTVYRFQRATGFLIGYNWPHNTEAIAPETA